VAYKVFTNGSVLNASEINDNLMNQSVMVFSNSTARAAALTSPLEGMLTWLQDTNKYENYNGSAWVALGGSAILQVQSTTKLDTFTTSSTTFSDVTGLSVSITPSSTSSKILVTGSVNIGGLGFTTNAPYLRLRRDSTDIALANTAGSRIRTYTGSGLDANLMVSSSVNFLDSPSTTSATTYKFQLASNSATLVSVNRNGADADNAFTARGVSTITVMEVAG
jgi:hypothetical protein